MAPLGFSTGTLAYGEFRLGLRMLHGKPAAAVELSALRDTELAALVAALDALKPELSQFAYVSVHAPSRYETLAESEVLDLLAAVFERGWPVVVHPDVIQDWDAWNGLGSLVCIENMDKRKPIGRTERELSLIFERLPVASWCLDLGHARQVDPTMTEAAAMLRAHGTRLRQLHVSDVNSASRHEPLNMLTEAAFSRIARLIPSDTPIILETPVCEAWIARQMALAQRILRPESTAPIR